jgi:hypothetical protein
MTEETTQSGETGIGSVLRVVSVVGLVLVAGACLAGGPRVMLAVAIGAGAAVANLWVIGRLVSSFLGGRGRMSWSFVAVVKLAVLFGGMFLLIKGGIAGVLPLLIGYGALPIGIVVAQLGGLSPVRGEG